MEALRDIKPILFVVFALLLVGCFAKYYTNVFGKYTYYDVKRQYELLFDMPWSELEKFVEFNEETGECAADVHKLRDVLKKKGMTIKRLYERYCRDERIKVPFPRLVDYQLNQPVNLWEVVFSD